MRKMLVLFDNEKVCLLYNEFTKSDIQILDDKKYLVASRKMDEFFKIS